MSGDRQNEGHGQSGNGVGYFPEPFRDETAPSIVARYRHHLGLNQTQVSQEVYGKPPRVAF